MVELHLRRFHLHLFSSLQIIHLIFYWFQTRGNEKAQLPVEEQEVDRTGEELSLSDRQLTSYCSVWTSRRLLPLSVHDFVVSQCISRCISPPVLWPSISIHPPLLSIQLPIPPFHHSFIYPPCSFPPPISGHPPPPTPPSDCPIIRSSTHPLQSHPSGDGY